MSQKTNLVFVTLLSLFLPLSVANAFEFRTPTDQAIYEQFGSEITEEQYGAVTHAMEQTGLEDPNDALDSAMHDEDLDSLTAACGESGECEDGEDYSSYANEADQADQEDGDSESSEEEDGDDAESSAEEGEAPAADPATQKTGLHLRGESLGDGEQYLLHTDENAATAVISLLNRILNNLLFFVTGVAVVIIVYNAANLVNSMGNEEKLKAIKSTFTWIGLGLGLIILSYVLVNTVITALFQIAG